MGTSPLDAFQILDLRVGCIVSAALNSKARKPSYVLQIDFGPFGVKSSSAQLTELYTAEDLLGRLVIAAVNLGPRNIAGVKSEVLTLGLPDDQGRVVLLQPERNVPLGGRVF